MTMGSERSAVLQCPMPANDSGASTVGGYLVALLRTVWQEREGFSGKRPFGNSGWEYEIYTPLVVHGLVEGTLDEDGYLDRCDNAAADKLIMDAINGLMEVDDV